MADGRVIRLTGRGSRLGLLGTGVWSSHTGTVHVTCTDGTSADIPVEFPDWYGNKAGAHSRLAVTTADWNRPPPRPPSATTR